MTKTIILKDGTAVNVKQFDSVASLFNKVLIPKFGNASLDFSVEEVLLAERLINDGWEVCDLYWGDSEDKGLHAALAWFKFNGIPYDRISRKDLEYQTLPNDALVSLMLCVNYKKGEISVYHTTDRHLLARFTCYADMKECLRHLDCCIPAKIVPATELTVHRVFSSADETIQHKGEIRQKALTGCKPVCTWEIDKDKIEF